MEEFVAYIIKNLVSVPGEVSISSSDDQERISIEIRVAKEDVGKVIGRRGNTINALRTIVRTVATRLGRKVQIELIQPDQPVTVIEDDESESCCAEESESCCAEESESCCAEESESVAEPCMVSEEAAAVTS